MFSLAEQKKDCRKNRINFTFVQKNGRGKIMKKKIIPINLEDVIVFKK